MKRNAATYRYFYLTLAAALTQAALTYALSITRFYTFKTSIVDLGVFTELLGRMVAGLSPVTSMVPPFNPQNWFGFHFSPLLYALAPLFALWPSPECLLAAQSLLLASCAPLVFGIGIRMKLEARDAAFFALLALINPFLIGAALFDFHEVALAVPLMAVGLWAVVARRWVWLLAACVGLMLTKENYGLSVLAFGLLWKFRYADWKRAGPLMVLGLSGVALILFAVMPAINGSGAHPMMGNAGTQLYRYGWIAPSWAAVKQFIAIMFSSADLNFPGILYLALLLACVGYLPLLAPSLLLLPAAGDLFANLLSLRTMPRLPHAYHSAALIPVLLVATMEAWRSTGNLALRRTLGGVALLVSLTLLTAPGAVLYWEIDKLVLQPTSADRDNAQVVGELIKDCKVPLVQASISAWLPTSASERPFPEKLEKADCIALHLYYPYARMDKALLSSPYAPLAPKDYLKAATDILKNQQWKIAYWNSPWLVLKKTGAENPKDRQGALENLKALATRE